ncbi:hypothetical protein D9753_00155 (plasmid) [Streptomyces dangxiongensis]|uniref:HTH cro/C1-type domain-containing protein n=1 Tax=Streptomyces dangxiongensis TaxID=1442032 RepID=A0A3G2J661_9ACTN|nr:hypothetical protein [Streptomyces dangxiongensis]AYN37678.1 hypothetical protein D9753_00155 [Streptomyces dangxiongensis]
MVVPSGMRAARDVSALAGRLVTAERLRLPLNARFDLVEHLLRQLERFTGAAVHEARQSGAGWNEVAAAAGVTAAQARTRWDEVALRALFPALPWCDRRRAQQRLSDALAYLQAGSSVPVDEGAERAGITLPYLTQILEGDCLPTWPEVYTLASVFGGRAEDLRVLWESASGTVRSPGLPAKGAAGYLAAGLRGLYLSAGSPRLDQFSQQALLPECLDQVLAGHHAPPWPVTARLVRALGGRAEEFEPLWQAARQAAIDLRGAASSDYLGCAGCRDTAHGAP